DLGDGRLGQVAPAHGVLEEALPDAAVLTLEARVQRRLLLVLHLLRAAEIVPGREVLAGAGEDDDADRVVGDRPLEGIVELFEQDAALRVQDLRTVGRDLENGTSALRQQGRVAHAATLSSGARPAPIRSTKLSQ